MTEDTKFQELVKFLQEQQDKLKPFLDEYNDQDTDREFSPENLNQDMEIFNTSEL
jgi:hypothetical protein